MPDENQETEAPEVKSYTQEEVDKLVSGLKSNNEKLLGEKKAAQAAELAKEEEARIARDDASRKNGDIESLEKSYINKHQETVEAYEAKIKKRDDLILGGDKKAAINDLSSMFIESERAIGKKLLDDMVEPYYNEEGQPAFKVKDINGEVIGASIDTLKEHLKTSGDFSRMISGVQMNGGGADDSIGNSGRATKKFNEYKPAELVAIKRNDPKKYQKLKKGN